MSEDVIEGRPLRLLDEKVGLPNAEMSLLIARSGVGKSAALINFALDELLAGRQVLHFTVGMTSDKTHQYYQEIYTVHSKEYPEAADVSYEELSQKFMVVSYLDPEKLVNELENEINTVVESAQLKPSLILVDGLDVDESTASRLAHIKATAGKHDARVFVSLRIHRAADGHIDLETPIQAAKNHTDHIFLLEPMESRIHMAQVSESGKKDMPIYFCHQDLTFRHG